MYIVMHVNTVVRLGPLIVALSFTIINVDVMGRLLSFTVALFAVYAPSFCRAHYFIHNLFLFKRLTVIQISYGKKV